MSSRPKAGLMKAHFSREARGDSLILLRATLKLLSFHFVRKVKLIKLTARDSIIVFVLAVR